MESESTTNRDDLDLRLSAVEALLKQAKGADLARQYAAALLREAINPLEIINNLVYVTKADASDPARVSLYMELIQDQLNQLNELTRRTLRSNRPAQR